MTTKVYDIDGQERDLEWLAETYDGATVLPARILPGDTEVWRLAAIYCTTGNVLVKVNTVIDTVPVNTQPVAMCWPILSDPDATNLPRLVASPRNWSERAVVQRTDDRGVTGFGIGSTFGPFYHVWVVSSAPSDCLSKIGMKGGTNHNGPLHGVWSLEDAEPDFVTLPEALSWHAQANQRIQFNPQAALQARIFADGFVPNSPEFDVVWVGTTYRAQRAEHLGTGKVRAYYCQVDHWDVTAFVEW